jgi:hypothetical protein
MLTGLPASVLPDGEGFTVAAGCIVGYGEASDFVRSAEPPGI